jgi:hypothetical protein
MDSPNLPVHRKAGVDHLDHLGLAGNQEDYPFQVFLRLCRFGQCRHESSGLLTISSDALLCFLSFSTQGSFLSRDSWYSSVVQLVRSIFVVECQVGVYMFVGCFCSFLCFDNAITGLRGSNVGVWW